MDKPQKNRRIKKRKPGPRVWLINLWVVISLLGIMALTAAGALFYLWNNLRPMPAGNPAEVTITKGMSAKAVSTELEEKGIIRNGTLFSYYLKLKKEGSRFQAGIYELSPGMERDEIIAKLNSGDIIQAETVKFTIPEGFTVEQIADKLAKENLVDKQKFLALVNENRRWGDVESMQSLPQEATKLKYRLEGYLFPDTYEVKTGSTEEEIILRLLSELDRKLTKLPEGWEAALEQSGLSFHEMMTAASLVEREVIVDEERPMVASVIFNRIAQKMRLQIDATVQYVLDEQKERLLNSDLEIDSPFNTYRNDGLPPGPIAAPSLDSIKAVLYPEKSDYLFYVTKKDGTQTHYFAKTYKEHQKNIAKSNKEGK